MVRLAAHELAATRKTIMEKRILDIPRSCGLLVEGYHDFEDRRRPASLGGVNFTRIAGQAVNLKDENSRSEVRRMLGWIRTGGAFLILGHGGKFGCGAVAAKKAALRGELDEPPEVMRLVDEIPDKVGELESPDAEIYNARAQAEKICADTEFGVLIARKNITMVMGVFHSDDEIEYQAINQPGERWNDKKLRLAHPKLQVLCDQLRRALNRVRIEQIDLSTHYAHAIFVYDPFQMAKVLDPFHPRLDIGGFSCGDSRLSPRVASYRYLVNPWPGEISGVTIERNGDIRFSGDDLGFIIYMMRHVRGVASLKGNGSGHIVCLDTSIEAAGMIRMALLRNELIKKGTMDGQSITTAAFDGRVFRIENTAHEVGYTLPYAPRYPILTE